MRKRKGNVRIFGQTPDPDPELSAMLQTLADHDANSMQALNAMMEQEQAHINAMLESMQEQEQPDPLRPNAVKQPRITRKQHMQAIREVLGINTPKNTPF